MTSFCNCETCREIKKRIKNTKCSYCGDHHDPRIHCIAEMKQKQSPSNLEYATGGNVPISPVNEVEKRGRLMKMYIILKNGNLTINDTAFQEVSDGIDNVFTKDQIMNANLPKELLLEIASGGWDDTCQREQIMEHLSQKYIQMSWPTYSDNSEVVEKFNAKMKEFKRK